MDITITFDWTHVAVPVVGACFSAGIVLLCAIVAERARSIYGGILGYMSLPPSSHSHFHLLFIDLLI